MHSISNKRVAILAVFILIMSFVLTRENISQAVAPDIGSWQSLGRQVLAQNDGWAAAEGGTIGGTRADANHILTVTNLKQLLQALGGGNKGTDTTPKIIFIKGIINGNEDDTDKPLNCKAPNGPLEDASGTKESTHIQILIPSNTTIIGDPAGARVVGASFALEGVKNVIIRNIQFENVFDCFLNLKYDNMAINGSNHVWIDHNSFIGAIKPNTQRAPSFGDGLLDIVRGSDLITVSWNRFSNHNKMMLIGASDEATDDNGKLRVTLHHNDFRNIVQRSPRTRYGQVHTYNNYNNQMDNASLQYTLGVGISSRIFAQNNYYLLPLRTTAAGIIKAYQGTAIHTEGDMVNKVPIDLLKAYNATRIPTLKGDVSWTPTFHGPVDPTRCVPSLVPRNAGVTRTFTVLQNSRANFSPTACPIL